MLSLMLGTANRAVKMDQINAAYDVLSLIMFPVTLSGSAFLFLRLLDDIGTSSSHVPWPEHLSRRLLAG